MKDGMGHIKKAIEQIKSQMTWNKVFTLHRIEPGVDIVLEDGDIVFCDIETRTAVFVTKKQERDGSF